jgi:pyruvate dehydrogenase E2 component (dihydrolipoamide acetyltransferase)
VAKTINVEVPDIGDFESVEVIEVLVSVGDQIAFEDSLITLESDKATMEIPSPAAGAVMELKVSVGDAVAEGDVILVIGADLADVADPAEEEPEAEPEPKPPVETSATSNSGTPYASPAVRRLARELEVGLDGLKGTGRKGRITNEDLREHVKALIKGAAATPAAAPSAGSGFNIAKPPKVNYEKFGDIEIEPLSRIKKISGPVLHRNWVTIPHVTQHDEADITEMESFRKSNKELAEAKGIKLTPVAFLMKACVAALKEFPLVNSSLSDDGESLVLKKYFNIGVAVDTKDGLIVPVFRDCDKKGLLELASELAEVSGRTREGKLQPKELQGGCFSISSLGGIGGTGFTPIVNLPEVAILGVSRSSMKPVWDGTEFRPRMMLPISLSYDHRVIDGATAARFTRYFADTLADMRKAVL